MQVGDPGGRGAAWFRRHGQPRNRSVVPSQLPLKLALLGGEFREVRLGGGKCLLQHFGPQTVVVCGDRIWSTTSASAVESDSKVWSCGWLAPVSVDTIQRYRRCCKTAQQQGIGAGTSREDESQTTSIVPATIAAGRRVTSSDQGPIGCRKMNLRHTRFNTGIVKSRGRSWSRVAIRRSPSWIKIYIG